MEKKLIKTDNYLLVVDDSEIKFRDWFINPKPGYKPKRFLKRGAFEAVSPKCDKVIAHLPLNDSPILERVPLLPPLEQEDDVEKLAEEEYPIIPNTSPNVNWDRANKQEGFERGYNKAREKYKFTEEDVRKAIEWVNNGNGSSLRNTEFFYPQADKFIQSLSQPNTPSYFEFETEITHEGNGTYSTDLMDIGLSNLTPIKVIKTTTNSQGQQVACGKYIY